MPAVDAILTHPHPDDAMEQALVGFLAADSERAREHRLQAAWWLCRRGNWSGFPVLLKDLAVEGKLEEEHPKEAKRLLALAPGRLVEVSVEAFLFGGSGVAAEEMVVTRLLGRKRTDPELVTECARRLLVDCSLGKTRNAAVQILRHCDSRHTKLRQVADAFAWGVRTGRELTGKLFKVEMHGGRELGFTFLQGTTVYITPLPLIQGERHGRDVVEGLILHEIGHHLYHRENDVWVEAEKEQVHSLLNLAADEHLERRLRVVDPVFGDRFKRLAAHAFQHSAREVDVDDLLNCLCGRAFGVLTAARLGVARAAGHVRVDNGSILVALERAGLSLPRFIRALRMGLGNRHGDEKVALGLALFSRGFRDKDTAGLLETARELRRIFGVEAALLELFSQDMSLLPGEGEVLIRGEGITDDELQTEIDRILNPRTRSATKGRGRGGRFMNLSDDERFERISNVVRLPYDRSRYAVYAARVARNARRMRQYFEELGLAYEPRRFRVRGKSVDRARLQALVLRGDPRVLVARELRVQTDLFLGVLVDCSGSMATNERIERAKHFAILLAEAARGMQRVSLRVFGFTDSVIFDAGDARRCAAAALESEGGNNDAAALWHAAQAARRSRRKARLLVMISDGSPTECSTGALKALVRHLSRRERICCAQVAVRPIDVVCFPHYVEIESQETGEAVRRFGKLIVDLVQKTISK
jgi:hypothetical protein